MCDFLNLWIFGNFLDQVLCMKILFTLINFETISDLRAFKSLTALILSPEKFAQGNFLLTLTVTNYKKRRSSLTMYTLITGSQPVWTLPPTSVNWLQCVAAVAALLLSSVSNPRSNM